MIGVICFEHERPAARQFFRLFKTPWEFYKTGSRYEIILSTGPETEIIQPDLLILYSSKPLKADKDFGITGEYLDSGSFGYRRNDLPLYKGFLKFQDRDTPCPDRKVLLECVYRAALNNRPFVRIGYDIFEETDFLLNTGQPAVRAQIPALELHISLLRELIVTHGIPVIEIPPVPAGYNSITCLTHDVDFIRITDHRFDSTMFGFIHRALFGSVLGILNGRGSWKKLLKNWAAALSLPGVYLGLFRDFFNNIQRYLEIEKGLPSTFFLIPFKNHSGKNLHTGKKVKRAVKYDVDDIGSELQLILGAGCEIGLHGIDAWNSREEGEKELLRIKKHSLADQIGIRMHWLFLDRGTPEILEETGFFYDSTMGYNETVGFKNGTAQVFRFPGAEKLSELPLIIMDTALFYPDRMNLREPEAECLVKKVIGTVEQFGGVVTLNWHQRSLGPERQWGDFYRRLLEYLARQKSWFAGCGDAVSWFAKRDSVVFKKVELINNCVRAELKKPEDGQLPGIRVRLYKPLAEKGAWSAFESKALEYVDVEPGESSGIEFQI